MYRQNPESREYLLCVVLLHKFMEFIFGIFEEAWVFLYSLESSRQVRLKSFGSHRMPRFHGGVLALLFYGVYGLN